MKEILNFISEYWRVLIVLVIQIVTFVILLCKKKVRIDDVFKTVLMMLPDIINLAESKFLVGSEKYAFVFNRCVEVLASLTHWSSEKVISDYAADLDRAIENILSTPQKKER